MIRPNTAGGKLFEKIALDKRVPIQAWSQPGMRALLSYKWEKFGSKYFTLNGLVFAFYLVLFSIVTSTPNALNDSK